MYFVYGWFRLYNDDPFSAEGGVLQCHYIANAFKKSKKHVKFIIGLRSDFHSLYHKYLDTFYGELFPYRVDLDTFNKTLDKQYEDHYDKMIEAPCENSGCKCKSLKIDIIKREEGKIGIPLKLAILAKVHNL